MYLNKHKHYIKKHQATKTENIRRYREKSLSIHGETVGACWYPKHSELARCLVEDPKLQPPSRGYASGELANSCGWTANSPAAAPDAATFQTAGKLCHGFDKIAECHMHSKNLCGWGIGFSGSSYFLGIHDTKELQTLGMDGRRSTSSFAVCFSASHTFLINIDQGIPKGYQEFRLVISPSIWACGTHPNYRMIISCYCLARANN